MNTTIVRRVSSQLLVLRTGIRFQDVGGNQVSIEIEIENGGALPSQPASLRLEAAPFGAFVPWRPLATVTVPAIPARGTAVVRAVARRPRPQPVGSFSGLVPPALVVAAGSADERRRTATARTRDRVLPAVLFMALLRRRSTSAELPPDLWDLLDGPQPHWAGNLNVWIADKPVERHLAPRLRIHPGRANLAAFCVGDRPDRYAFQVEGADEDWGHALFDAVTGKQFAWSGASAAQRTWHAVQGMEYVVLVLRPPGACERGAVLVHVTQRSSWKTAVVEFDLDPAADGPGCYTL